MLKPKEWQRERERRKKRKKDSFILQNPSQLFKFIEKQGEK